MLAYSIEEFRDFRVTQSYPLANISVNTFGEVAQSTSKVVGDFFVDFHDIETRTLKQLSSWISPVPPALSNDHIKSENFNVINSGEHAKSVSCEVQSITGGVTFSEVDDKFGDYFEWNKQIWEGQMIVPTLPLDANFGGSRKPTQGSTHVVLMNDDEFGDLTNCSKLKHYLSIPYLR